MKLNCLINNFKLKKNIENQKLRTKRDQHKLISYIDDQKNKMII